jgi:hypothetical protein
MPRRHSKHHSALRSHRNLEVEIVVAAHAYHLPVLILAARRAISYAGTVEPLCLDEIAEGVPSLAAAERMGASDLEAAAGCASSGASTLEAGFSMKRMAVAPNTIMPSTSMMGMIGPLVMKRPRVSSPINEQSGAQIGQDEV